MAESSSKSTPQNVSVAEFQQLKQKFEDLLVRQKEIPSASSSRVTIEKDPPPEYGAPLKPTKLPEYHGNRVTYPAWRTAVLDTFRIDWNLFGYDNSRAFLMIFGALKGVAAEKAGPFYEAGGVNGTRDPEDFMEFLDRINLDSTRVSRANKELHKMKMKDGQRWPDFFAAWSNKVTEARGDFWPDENKISMLENALSDRLTDALSGNHLIPDDNFREWVNIVNKVAQKVEMADERRRWGPKQNAGLAHSFSGERRAPIKNRFQDNRFESVGSNIIDNKGYQAGDVDEAGDTIMSGVNSANVERRRAKWKTKEELDRLRQEGRCFRCERKGCISKKCPLLPARKPKNLEVRVNSTNLPEIDPAVYNIEDISGEELSVSEN